VIARDPQALIEGEPLRPVQLEVIALCRLINLVDGFDLLAIACAGPRLSAEWALSAATLGWVYSAGLVGMLLGATALAPPGDRHGRTPVVAVGLFLAGIGMLATAFAQSSCALVLLRMPAGVGIATLLACLTALVAEYSNDRSRNPAMGLFHSGYLVGALAGGLLAARIIDVQGWRALFAYGAALTLGLMLVAMGRLRESLQFLLVRRPAHALARVNAVLERISRLQLDALPAAGKAPVRAAVAQSWTAANWRCSPGLWSVFFLGMLTLYFLLSWIPKLSVDTAHAYAAAACAGALFSAGGIVGQLGIALAPRKALARAIAIALAAGAMTMIGLGLALTQVAFLLVLAALTGALVMCGFVGLYPVAAQAYPSELRVTVVGWATGIGRVGAIAGPLGAGAPISAGCPVPLLFAILAAPLAVIAALTPLLRPPAT
jgi:benzoate transport